MKYIKFIIKCICAASPAIALVLYTLLCPMCYMDEDYASWRYTEEVTKGNVDSNVQYDTVILGDSSAMSSFVPDRLSESCINLAVGGATSIEMYFFLKNYLECHEAPQNVVVMFTPFHYANIDNYKTRTMYFKALSVMEARELYSVAKATGVSQIYDDNTVWDEIACRAGLPNKYLPAITASHFIGRYDSNRAGYEAIVNSRGYGMFGTQDGCDGLSYECAYTQINYGADLELLTLYFEKLYSMCRDNNISVLLIQPALNEASYNAIDQGYVDTYTAYIDMMAGLCVGLEYENELRCYPNEYFGDVSHLNSRGAEKFSDEIKSLYPDVFK